MFQLKEQQQPKITYTQANFIINPFKQVTPLETNCILKSVFAAIAGGGFGLVMAIFTNAVEFREMDLSRGVKHSAKAALKMDMKRMIRQTKGFAAFGFGFAMFECLLEKMRHRDDGYNSFYSGTFTTMMFAAEAVGPKGMLLSGIPGGLFGMIMYKVQTLYM